MKEIVTYFLITCGAMCALSCGETSEDNIATIENTDLDVFKVYELDTAGQKVRFADMIESVELMRLEETDASLLSFITELVETDDHYLLTSGRGGDLFFYSKEGKYEFKINREGEGPEEYLNIEDKWVSDDTLFVYSNRQNKLHR
jgi:hypothetical protein